MGKSFMIRVPMALFLAGVITFGCTGCQAIKMAMEGQSPEGVVHESYPINAYAYSLSLVMHTSPEGFF